MAHIYIWKRRKKTKTVLDGISFNEMQMWLFEQMYKPITIPPIFCWGHQPVRVDGKIVTEGMIVPRRNCDE